MLYSVVSVNSVVNLFVAESMFLPCRNNSFAQHATKMRQHLQVVVVAGGLVEEDLRGVRELSSS